MTQKKSPVVVSLNVKGHKKEIGVLVGKTIVKINCPRHSPISRNDPVCIENINASKISTIDVETNEKIIILPEFHIANSFKLGDIKYNITIKEISTDNDLKQWEYLEEFHYRTHSNLIADENTKKTAFGGGRACVLILYIEIGKKKFAAGYVEIAQSLLMVGPRKEVFSSPYKHPKYDIDFEKWDHATIAKYANRIARISRIVVHPTYRGIGLTKPLILAAKTYATERWNLSRKKPIFLEILAEMLNHIDFVSSSGFIFCGYTEGNLVRLAADMRAMKRGQKISTGIMSLQEKYKVILETYANDKLNGDFDAVIKRLEYLSTLDNPEEEMSDEEWSIFKQVIRPKRPYYLLALDEYSEKYLSNFSKQKQKLKTIKKKSVLLDIRNIKIEAEIGIENTDNVLNIMKAFGLSGSYIKQNLVSMDAIKATSGNVFLITGVSGSGKTVLLEALANKKIESLNVSFDLNKPYTYSVMQDFDQSKVLIDFFAEKFGLRQAIRVLSAVGLAEATILVKPLWMLSRGQKYRVKLADLIFQDKEVWLADEFCADLDPITAQLIASNFSRSVRKYGRIAFVAAANNNHFIDALSPTRIINFDIGLNPKILSLKEYKNGL